MTTESFSLIFAGILIHNGMEHIAKTACNRAEESRRVVVHEAHGECTKAVCCHEQYSRGVMY
jgi:hypothetical protein